MDLDQINAAAADLERGYRDAVTEPLDRVVLAADRALVAARAARDQTANADTDEQLKTARGEFDQAVDDALGAVATARGSRTKALKKAGLR